MKKLKIHSEHNLLLNPLYEFEGKIDLDVLKKSNKLDEIVFFIKTIKSNFLKLYHHICNYHNFKSVDLKKIGVVDNFFYEGYLEFFYFKVSSIFDLCYQVYSVLCEVNVKPKIKYITLQKEFERYCSLNKSISIQFSEFQEINKIRNSIIHGGVYIRCLYFKVDQNWGFQAQDRNYDDLILIDKGYFLNDFYVSIEKYMNYNYRVLHHFIKNFLNFILVKLNCADEPIDFFLTRETEKYLESSDDLFVIFNNSNV